MSDAQLWYAGLPVTGSRMLSDDERKHVAWVASDLTKKIGGSLAVIIGLIVVAIIATLANLPGIALLTPLIIVGRRGRLRNANLLPWLFELRRDAREGSVLVCKGQLSQVLGSLGGPTVSADRPVTIEVLPRSALLWTRDGRRQGDPIAVSKSTTSIMSEHARMAANFVRPVEGSTDLLMHQRTLNEGEVAEVQRSIPAFPTVQFLGAVALALGVVLCALMAWIEQSIGFVILALVAVWLAYMTAKALPARIRFRIAMRRDVRVRTAIIVRRREEEGLGIATEFLAASGVVWSNDGDPAPWRKMRG